MIFESIDLYVERLAKLEQDNLKYLYEWKEKLRELADEIIRLKEKFKRPNQKILNDHDVNGCLRKLHENFALVPTDKAASNIIIICKTYYSAS